MDYQFISGTELFRGISKDEIESMLKCLGAFVKTYTKGGTVYREEMCIGEAGLVLCGAVHIEQEDIWGNRN